MPLIELEKTVGFAEEAAYNDPITPATDWMLAQKASSIEPNIGRMYDDAVHGSPVRHDDEMAEGLRSWKGKLPFAIPHEGPAFGKLLKHLFGKVVTSTVAAGVYDHLFTPQAGQFKGLTFCHKFASQQMIVAAGGRIAGGKITFKTGAFAIADLDIEGGTYTEEAVAGTPSFPTVKTRHVFQDGLLQVASNEVKVSEIEITAKAGLAAGESESYVLGSGERVSLDRTTLEFTGIIKRRHKADDPGGIVSQFFTAFDAFSTLDLAFLLSGPEIGSTGQNYEFEILAKAILGEIKRTPSAGIYLEEIPFTCVQTASADAISFRIRDSSADPASATGDYLD